MKTERFAIKNRHGLKLTIQVDTLNKPKDLVFIEPGQGGFKEQSHIQAFRDAFLENNYRVVLFDPTNSIGESGGNIKDVTTTNYLEDLDDVIQWAKKQDWYQQPFALCGHSMGGMSAGLYAENNPKQVSLLIPASTVINYELSEVTRDPDSLKNWKSKGYYEQPSASKPGIIKRIGWAYMKDLKKYNLLKDAKKLTMPVLLLAGDLDRGTPISHQKILLDVIPSSKKELLKLENADHNYRGSGDYSVKINEVKNVISSWLRDIDRLTP